MAAAQAIFRRSSSVRFWLPGDRLAGTGGRDHYPGVHIVLRWSWIGMACPRRQSGSRCCSGVRDQHRQSIDIRSCHWRSPCWRPGPRLGLVFTVEAADGLVLGDQGLCDRHVLGGMGSIPGAVLELSYSAGRAPISSPTPHEAWLTATPTAWWSLFWSCSTARRVCSVAASAAHETHRSLQFYRGRLCRAVSDAANFRPAGVLALSSASASYYAPCFLPGRFWSYWRRGRTALRRQPRSGSVRLVWHR